MQVIGQHTERMQPLGERDERRSIVVDAAQQHALVEQQRAGVAQPGDGFDGVALELLRVVHMQHHGHAPRQALDPLDEAVVDARGQHDGVAGVQTERSQVRDVRELAPERLQARVAERQRVAAAQDQLLDRRVRGEGGDGVVPTAGFALLVLVRELPTEAITTVHRAGAGGHEQRTATVFVEQTRCPACVGFLQRVAAASGRGLKFLGHRQHLTQQGIGRIAATHTRHEAARHPHREHPRRLARGPDPRLGQAEQRREFYGVGHGCREIGLPRGTRPRGGCGGRLAGEGGCGYHERPFRARHSGSQRTRIQAMGSYNTSEFKSGLKILLDGVPFVIVENEMVKPGKGQAFNRVRVRNLKTGRTVEKTWKSGDSVEAADVMDVDMQYLYQDGDFFHFMVPDNFEQHTASKEAVGDGAQWLKDGVTCIVTLWNGVPLVVTPPPHIEALIVETDPGVRGDTATGGQKPAKLETGAVVRVPLFINQGEVIKVDTRSGEYISRAKQ